MHPDICWATSVHNVCMFQIQAAHKPQLHQQVPLIRVIITHCAPVTGHVNHQVKFAPLNLYVIACTAYHDLSCDKYRQHNDQVPINEYDVATMHDCF